MCPINILNVWDKLFFETIQKPVPCYFRKHSEVFRTKTSNLILNIRRAFKPVVRKLFSCLIVYCDYIYIQTHEYIYIYLKVRTSGILP